jgi:CBS domain-containing protein
VFGSLFPPIAKRSQYCTQHYTIMTLNSLLSSLFLLALLGHTSAFSSSQRVFISTPAKNTNRIVSDLMTSEPHLFTLSPKTPVDEAIATLLAAGVSGAPVVEHLKNAETGKSENRLVGFVSSFDFLPREETGTLVSLGDDSEDSETARRILGQTVKDIMTSKPVTVTTNDLMKKAAETMAKHRLHALPVVDAKRGNLVGIVTAKDVMRDVMKTAKHCLPAENNFSQKIADIRSP